MIILDVGAGTAGCASILAASPDDTVVAVDNNIQYLKRHGPAPGKRAVSRVVADAARVPIRSDRIDTVVCTEMLEHVPNYQAVIAELSRVGRPGC